MDKRIYIKTWLVLKPYNNNVVTDTYYLNLANKIKSGISIENKVLVMQHVDVDDFDLLCCFLSSYLEDIVSEVGIWKTFILEHEKLYGKKLPFINTDIYYEDEINRQDVLFLIWYFLNSYQEGIMIAPLSLFNIAEDVMKILDDAFEYAPENNFLKRFYFVDNKEQDFFKIREAFSNILYHTWLFFPDTGLNLKFKETKIIEEDKDNVEFMLYENRDTSFHSDYTALLSFKGNEWLAKLLGKEHFLYNDILKITKKIKGLFFYKKQDSKYIYFEHIASEKQFAILKDSFDDHVEYKIPNSIAYIGIVKWKNDWIFTGVSFSVNSDKNTIENEKKEIANHEEVSFLDYDSGTYKEIFEEQYQAFLDYNNGSPIAFVPHSEINNFYESYILFYNSLSGKLKKQRKEAEKKLKNKKSTKGFNWNMQEKGSLVFFNKNIGIEVSHGINNAFPVKNNPFYNEDNSNDDIIYLLFSGDVSKELAMYCVENYKDKLPFFKTKSGKKHLEDIDFLMRFFKKKEYHSKPRLSLIKS